MPTISSVLSLMHQPVSELLGYRRPRATSSFSESLTTSQNPLSTALPPEVRRHCAARWQGLARQVELFGDDIQCSARTESCQDFNGDFYGLREQGSGKTAFFLGDVSGKGLRAAFYQASCLTLLQHAARMGLDPAEVMNQLNLVMAEREDEDRFATVIYGVFDKSAYTLTLVSAGHPPPLLLSAGEQVQEIEMSVGLPIGLYPDISYRSQVIGVRPGDTLMVYSDGLSEARNSDKDFLGEAGLLQMLVRSSHLDLPDMTNCLMTEVEEFAGKRRDDQTIMALRFGDTAGKTCAAWPQLEIDYQAVACA